MNMNPPAVNSNLQIYIYMHTSIHPSIHEPIYKAIGKREAAVIVMHVLLQNECKMTCWNGLEWTGLEQHMYRLKMGGAELS